MSEYTLYTDREENFNCEIAVEGARLRDSFARIILETHDFNLAFNGTIDEQGRCDIPIKPLKHLLENSDKGKMVLEIVADDTYFRPWESNFIVDSYKKVEVKINEISIPSKPRISVSVVEPKKKSIKQKEKRVPIVKRKLTMEVIINELTNNLNNNGITAENLSNKKNIMSQVVTKYFKENKIKSKYKNKILKSLVENLIKG